MRKIERGAASVADKTLVIASTKMSRGDASHQAARLALLAHTPCKTDISSSSADHSTTAYRHAGGFGCTCLYLWDWSQQKTSGSECSGRARSTSRRLLAVTAQQSPRR